MIDRENIAEHVLGWQKKYSPDPTIYAWERPNGERMTCAALLTLPDTELVCLVQSRIAEIGATQFYIDRLWRYTTHHVFDVGNTCYSDIWWALRAKPHHHMWAALDVINQKTGQMIGHAKQPMTNTAEASSQEADGRINPAVFCRPQPEATKEASKANIDPSRITSVRKKAEEVAVFYQHLRAAKIDDETARALTLQAMMDGRI